jgi:translation elongation factor EF-G
VEAQTVANCYTALDLGVTVVPVLNKMDLPQADPDNARQEIEEVIGIDATDAIPCSAKTGMGIDEILEAVVALIPPPKGNPDAALRAMIIDSWYDPYVGVVMLVRVVDGRLAKGDRIKLMASEATYNAEQLGVFTPHTEPRQSLDKPCRVSRRSSPRCLPAFIRRKPANTNRCAMRWKSSSSMMRLCITSLKSAKRWVLAFAAAFWACCTWRLSRSGWSANSTRT